MKGKKLLALALCLLMTVSLLPVSALAEGDGEEPAAPVATPEETVADTPEEGESPEEDPEDPVQPGEPGDEPGEPGEGPGEEPGEGPGEEPGEEPGAEPGDPVPADVDPNALSDDPDGTMETTETEYYLVGTRNSWNTGTGVRLSANGSNAGEYKVEITLTQGEEFKIIGVNGDNVTWYPGGGNYVVDANHAGYTTVYFRPDYQGGGDWYEGCIYVPAQPTKYAVNIRDIYPAGAGTVTASPASAAEGEAVTLTITENAGFRLRSTGPQIYYNGWFSCQKTQVDRLTYTFTMPAYPVYVDTYYDAAATIQIKMYDTTNGQQESNDCGTVTVQPTVGFQGDTVRATITVNEGYRLDPAWTTSWTLISQSGNEFVYDVPVGPNGIVAIYFDQHIYEGYYLRLSDADEDYRDWTCLSHKLIQGDSTFISTNNDVFYHAKVQLTVGQLLRVYHLSYSGNQLQGADSPVASYTVTSDDVVSGKLSTVYLKYAAAGSEIGVSALDGYYLVFTYPLPYNVQAKHKLTLQNGVYVNDEIYHGADRVRVAKFSEGTVVQVYLDGNSSVYSIPRDGTEYGIGPAGFPYGTYGPGALGRAWFDPNGGVSDYEMGGYLKIRRLFSVTYTGENCTFADNPATAPAGEPLAVTVTPENGYEVTSVVATWNDGADQSEELTLIDGKYTLAEMPPYPVTVTVTTEEKTYTITVNVEGVAANIEYSLWAFDSPDVHLMGGQTPEEAGGVLITDNVVPVGKSLGVYVTFNGAQRIECSISYIDIDGTEQGEGGTITPGANNAEFWQTMWYMGDGPATVTLTVDPVMIVLFSHFGPYDESYLGTAPVETIIPDNPFTRPGYVFTGWNTESDGSGTAYAPGDTVTLYTNIELTAQWVKEGYYLVKLTDTDTHTITVDDLVYAFRMSDNTALAPGTEYMIDSEEMPEGLRTGEKLWVVKMDANGLTFWDGGQIPSAPMYTVDDNHAYDDLKVYFRPETPTDPGHPGWDTFGGHLFIVIAREIRINPVIHGTVTASPVMGVYTETITLTVTPEAGYRLKSLEVWYQENEYDRNYITPENGVFTMPDYRVTVEAAFCLEDGYYLLGTMHDNDGVWDVNNLTPAMKFSANPENADEYMLAYSGFAATDEFKVVRLEDGEIAQNGWYGTSLQGHSTGDNGNYVINDQTGDKTVYFRPNWNNDWSGHIWIGDALPRFRGHSLVLTGQIGVQFLMDLPGGIDAYPDSYMTISGNKVDGEHHYTTPKTINYGGGDVRYAYTVYISSIQMADKFTPTFHYFVNGVERTIAGEPYSAEDYISYGLAHPEALGEKALAVVRALADYGYYAQRSLSQVNGWTIGVDYAEMTTRYTDSFDYGEVSAAVAQYEVDRSVLDGLNFRVVFGSLTDLEIRFTTVDGAEVKLDGVVVTPTVSGSYSVVSVKGIKATGLTKSHTLQVGETTVSISPMSYVQLMLGSASANTNDDLRNLLCAFYNYGAACAAYSRK